MTVRRPALLLVLSLLLVPAGLAGCGDDGDDGASTTTTEADGEQGGGGTTTEGTATDDSAPADGGTDDGSSTTEPAEDTTTSEGGSTTSPNLPPNDSPLAELLLDPAVVGEGYAPDDTLGDGSFDTDLCEEVTLEEAWEDQAAQALVAGTDEDAAIFQQSVLRFPDEATASDFVATVSEALVTCQEGTELQPVEGVGDEAVLATGGSPEATAAAGLVRVGPLVTWLLSITGPDIGAPVDAAVLAAAADGLTA